MKNLPSLILVLFAVGTLGYASEAQAQCVGGAPNGVFTPPMEECDDGNRINSDGCTNACRLPVCGDGAVRAPIEVCDDENMLAGDGCSPLCTIEAGWECAPPLVIEAIDPQGPAGGTLASWTVAADGQSATQNTNTTNPSVGYLAEADGFAAVYTFEIEVETTDDDDFIGFVLGYQEDEVTGGAGPVDYLLLDWKQTDQTICSGTARRGLSVSRVTGAVATGNNCDFWRHNGVVEEIARPTGAGSLGDVGWQDGRAYEFTIKYRPTSLVILVDGVEQVNIAPAVGETFPAGTMGFYGFSQTDVRYRIINPIAPSKCNRPPLGMNSAASVVTGTSTVAVAVPAGFSDREGDGLDASSIRVLSISGPGTVTTTDPGSGAADGTITLSPTNASTPGTYTVTYEFCDDDPVLPLCETASVSITYNDPPTLTAPGAATSGGGASFDVSDLIALSTTNAVDGGWDATSFTAATSDAGPFGAMVASAQGGTCTISGSELSYMEPAVLTGTTDSCEVQLCEADPGPVGPVATDRACDTVTVVFDLDADGDGIPSTVEGPGDFDGDGIPNDRDLDSDGDGILDAVELLADPDMDGPAFLDLDSDGDGVPDATEGHDTDGDGVPDTAVVVAADVDGNGVDDVYDASPATTPDHDTDTTPDYLDADDDGDGIPTSVEALLGNTDVLTGDTTPDYLDADDDGDGIDTAIECSGAICEQSDGDGIPDYRDLDSDNDGLLDSMECSIFPCANLDGDSLPNYRDADDDGDTLLTSIEIADQLVHGTPDTDGIDAWLDTDSDGDGALDSAELRMDLDGDGIPDYLDPDSSPADGDGDGIPDTLECGGLPATCPDTDGDGTPDFQDDDDDGDGIPTVVECPAFAACTDSDGDMFPDWRDVDDDNDGILTATEVQGTAGTQDTDGDSIFDHLDLDSDDDGIDDAVEGHDDDGDGIPDAVAAGRDGDADGLDDAFDGDCVAASDCGGIIGIPAPTPDQDGDDVADYVDLDSDDDGISDAAECGMVECPDTDGDMVPDYLDDDSDGDGVPDVIEGHDANFDGTPDVDPAMEDTDGDGLDDAYDADCDTEVACGGVIGVTAPLPERDLDGTPDWRDDDDDDDSIPTATEIADATTHGNPDTDGIPAYLDSDSDDDGASDLLEAGLDLDEDGIPDYLDPDSQPTDTDMDGIPDVLECADLSMPATCRDTDMDGTPDWQDPDDDGDGVPTIDERPAGDQDTDMDGMPDHLDVDDDGDGLPTADECGASTCRDTDEDGTPDYLDEDDDDDGILTADEIADGAMFGNDVDGDGNVNWLDTDSDGDGMSDMMEGRTDDSDMDGIPDYLDPDDSPADQDMDGLPDREECDDPSMVSTCRDTDGDGTPDLLDEDDDGDGIPTREELNAGVPRDTDGDGTPNHLDDDDDGDGIPTRTEREDAETFGDDVDDDGLVNWLDPNADGEGADDGEEGRGDDDGDGIPNYLDPTNDTATAGGVSGGAGCSAAPMQSAPFSLLFLVGWLLVRRRR